MGETAIKSESADPKSCPICEKYRNACSSYEEEGLGKYESWSSWKRSQWLEVMDKWSYHKGNHCNE